MYYPVKQTEGLNSIKRGLSKCSFWTAPLPTLVQALDADNFFRNAGAAMNAMNDIGQ